MAIYSKIEVSLWTESAGSAGSVGVGILQVQNLDVLKVRLLLQKCFQALLLRVENIIK